MTRRLPERERLQRGRHARPEDGRCAMEMVAWLAGEAHTDEPRCACPALAAVVRALNDAAPDALRTQLLRPLVPLLVASRSDAATARRRALAFVDIAVRELTPARLRRAGRAVEAAQLEGLGPIVDRDTLQAARSWATVVVPDDQTLTWLLTRAASTDPAEAWLAAVVRVAAPLGTSGLASVAALIGRTLRDDARRRRRMPAVSTGSDVSETHFKRES